MENQTNETNKQVLQNNPLPTLLENIIFHDLPNSAHYDYCGWVSEVLGNSGSVLKNAVTPARISQYNALLAIEAALMRWTYKSVLTAKIAESDHELDRALAAISTYVQTAAYSDDPLIVAAAERLRVMLRGFGRVSKKAYNAQEGDIEAILGSLHGAYAADVTALALETRVAKLQNAFNEFKALLHERDADIGEKPKENFSTVRHDIEEVYNQIVTIVNGGAALGLSQEFAAFINTLNPEIVRFNRQYHHAKINIKDAQPAQIPPQPFTGLPVTPLPEVLRVTKDGTERLVFGKDYSLTYRSNVDVGKAECIIHGKSKYKGSQTITFVIVR
jgi:hypothetical protein